MVAIGFEPGPQFFIGRDVVVGDDVASVKHMAHQPEVLEFACERVGFIPAVLRLQHKEAPVALDIARREDPEVGSLGGSAPDCQRGQRQGPHWQPLSSRALMAGTSRQASRLQ